MDFLDTNVLVYAASRRVKDAAKAAAARALIQPAGQWISLQVLQEFYRVAVHPQKLAYSHDEAVQLYGRWRKLFSVFEPDLPMFDASITICARYQLSYFDSAILAAAERCGCDRVLSEDMNDGQHYGSVRVENPFRGL